MTRIRDAVRWLLQHEPAATLAALAIAASALNRWIGWDGTAQTLFDLVAAIVTTGAVRQAVVSPATDDKRIVKAQADVIAAVNTLDTPPVVTMSPPPPPVHPADLRPPEEL